VKELYGEVAATVDLFGTLTPTAGEVTKASESVGNLALVEALAVEEFDQATINEADAVITSMHAAVAATEAANLSADGLRAALERM
jgi:hypothetical protein